MTDKEVGRFLLNYLKYNKHSKQIQQLHLAKLNTPWFNKFSAVFWFTASYFSEDKKHCPYLIATYARLPCTHIKWTTFNIAFIHSNNISFIIFLTYSLKQQVAMQSVGQPSEPVWGSLSYLRTLRHVDRSSGGSNQQLCNQWMTLSILWATAPRFNIFSDPGLGSYCNSQTSRHYFVACRSFFLSPTLCQLFKKKKDIQCSIKYFKHSIKG